MNTDFSLNSFFNFITENNKDLNPDHYQIAFRQEGLGIQLVLKYIQGSPDKEVVVGRIGLFL
ncbi:hypothetical protein FNW02_34365 [Komarekiella sp. 'clone 1']|uniref:Uncharacterized protein n=1 Tax=Komarekiella delphini-convector SJRDD-AB1 TaxID=2593771 RepID=A0AA40VUY9_9NOST|nr:hypothetical protein [Komarekiella delphini-convector]MBD6620712.1 hypothetical protein [Komarekiella delphini-convector SJRDD-AB1]